MAHLYSPEVFQGIRKRRSYFEGWYFKLISRDRSHVLALIPGIAMGKSPDETHAFIQVIDARRNHVAYLRYPHDAFHAADGVFDIRIGGNRFSGTALSVAHDEDGHTLRGDISFSDIEPYPRSLSHRGIMGPFTFVPLMECRHDIVNIRQSLHGKLEFDGEILDFEGGEGYVEKDWGRSFPSDWIWLQANHFDDPKVSFMFSIAEIPWLGSRFTGLISFLRTDEEFHRFATYNRSKLSFLSIEEGQVRAVIREAKTLSNKMRAGTLEMKASFQPGGVLRAPKNGLMDRTIEESISAEVSVRLTDRDGRVRFSGTSRQTGMEISEGAHRLAAPWIGQSGDAFL